jgi:hypothetical protein
MQSRALLPFISLVLACTITTDDEGANDSTTGDGDGDPTTGDGDPTTGDGDPSTGDGDPTTGDGDPTTGDGDGDQWCGLSEGPDEPWFELYQYGKQLGANDPLAVECGFQGFFMVELYPRLGGFVPTGDSVPFSVVLDVDGYNVGPNGHFAASSFNIYVACCEDTYYYGDCFYLTTSFILFPPDSISDLSVLHELPAQLTVTMTSPDGPIEQTLDVTMWALEEDQEWEFCDWSYLDPNVDPLAIDALPIPG